MPYGARYFFSRSASLLDDFASRYTAKGLRSASLNGRDCRHARKWVEKTAGRDNLKLKRYFYLVRPLLCLQWAAEHP
jgi:predicted nucleotidyltransferase